jgi:ABC-2 type transport system permease protein
MNKIPIIIQKEYLERVQSKGFIISTLLIPVVLSAMILLPILMAFLGRDAQSTIAMYDETGKYRAAIESSFNSQQSLSLIWVNWQNESEREATLNGLTSGKIAGYVLLKEINGKAEAVYTSRNAADFSLNRKLETTLQNAVSRLVLKNKGLTDAEIALVEKPIELKVQKLSGGKDDGGLSEFALAYVMAMLIYASMLGYGMTVMSAVMEEKNSRVMEVLAASVKPFDLLVGKVVGIGLVALTQYVVWALLGAALSAFSIQYNAKFQFDLPPLLLVYFVVYFILGYLIYTTLYAAVGSAFENLQDAQSLSTPITFLVVIPIIALNYVIPKPDSTVSIILSLVPFFSPILMIARLSISEPPFWQVALSLILMAATFYGAMTVSSKIYRVGILMYGKKPSIPEIVKWLKYA